MSIIIGIIKKHYYNSRPTASYTQVHSLMVTVFVMHCGLEIITIISMSTENNKHILRTWKGAVFKLLFK